MRKLFNIYQARAELREFGEYYQEMEHIMEHIIDYVVIRDLRFVSNRKEQKDVQVFTSMARKLLGQYAKFFT